MYFYYCFYIMEKNSIIVPITLDSRSHWIHQFGKKIKGQTSMPRHGPKIGNKLS